MYYIYIMYNTKKKNPKMNLSHKHDNGYKRPKGQKQLPIGTNVNKVHNVVKTFEESKKIKESQIFEKPKKS